jgi:hypothetical protein
MNYSKKLKARVEQAPKTLGTQLARWAIHRQFSIIRIAACTGATRQTVYNYFSGGEVTRAYRPAVVELIKILRACETADDAWGLACNTFNLEA